MAAVTLLQKWQLLQAILADAELSATAKLVAARLLYHQSAQTGRCSPSYQTLADGIALKRRAVINAVQELESRDWLSVLRVKGGDPAAARGFVTNAFRINFDHLAELPPVHDDALPPSAPSDTPPSAPSDTPPGASPCTPPGAPLCTPGVHGDALPPVHGGAPNSGKDTGKGNREESPPTPSDFDRLWEAYPLKVGKDEAHQIFLRTIHAHKGTAEEMIAGAQRYAEAVADREPQYIKQLSNWLRGRHWNDEPPRPRNPSNGSGNAGRRDFSATRDWYMTKVDADE